MRANLQNIRFQTVAIRRNRQTQVFPAFIYDDALCSNGLLLRPRARYARLPESVKDFVAGENTLINPDGEVATSPCEWLLNHGVELVMEVNTDQQSLHPRRVLNWIQRSLKSFSWRRTA
jgi:hypothetical protein